ncbi:MAG TPA: TIGR00730 family Rossman fold protein [Alphaproteobacteria bacterium]
MVKITSVCVFCGSSFGQAERYREEAARLGGLLAEHGIALIYGGGGVGLMGVLAQAALAAGGQVIGVIPRFLERAERGVHSLTRLEVVESMHERKERMFALSDAFIILPGGFGTLDETFEILTWKLLALHDKPVVLVDLDGYWRPLEQLIDHVIANGFAHAPSRASFRTTQSVDAALAEIARAPQPRVAPAAPERL